jgi:Hemerythrin HHE cation binding domain
MNIFQALIVSHQKQRELCERVLDAKQASEESARIFEELKNELAAHETAEERFFYVPLFDHDSTVDASRHAIAEHHEMDEMVEDLEKIDPHAVEWALALHKLCDKIAHHLKEEEEKFFPQAGEVLTEEQKVSLAADYEAEHQSMLAKAQAEA